MSERSGDGWSGGIGGYCPVQGEGVCNGRPWYFRAKYDQWSFDMAERADADAVDVGYDEPGWRARGEAESAGYMKDYQAWSLIEQSIEAFRAGKLERVEARKGIRRELAVEATSACYDRALGRLRQIECAPHAREILLLKAGEARAAGDDIMLAVDMKPDEHPGAAEVLERFRKA